MEQLWAPWRMQFIEELRDRGSGCVFCELHRDVEGGDDRSRLVLHRAGKCYVLMNRFPYNNGHLMVIPDAHTGSLSGLDAETRAEAMSLCSASVEILGRALGAEGFNCGFNIGKSAGAGIVDHVHQHVVPRWCGDANFLPIIGNTRSMPEYLSDTYDRLRPGFEKLGGLK